MKIASLNLLTINSVSQDFWSLIPIETLLALIYFIVVPLLVLTLVFYIAGVIVVGKQHVRIGDAFVISLLGTVVSSICFLFFSPLIGLILSLIIWLLLIRRYYETGWLGAIGVAILAAIVSIAVSFILASLLDVQLDLLRWLAFTLMF